MNYLDQQWIQLHKFFVMLICQSQMLPILFLLVVHHVFHVFNNYFKISSMVNNHAVVLIQMKPLLMVPQFKQLLLKVIHPKQLKIFFFLMLLHFHLVLKQQVKLWQFLFHVIQQFQLRNQTFLQHLQIINQQLQLKFMKVNVQEQEIIIF